MLSSLVILLLMEYLRQGLITFIWNFSLLGSYCCYFKEMKIIWKIVVSISALILTHNEEKHIKRCIESLLPFVSDVFIVDSYSSDSTVEIARV